MVTVLFLTSIIIKPPNIDVSLLLHLVEARWHGDDFGGRVFMRPLPFLLPLLPRFTTTSQFFIVHNLSTIHTR